MAQFNEVVGCSLKYSGESPGAVAAAAFEELAKPSKHREVGKALRRQIHDDQGGLCADCGDRLGRFEIDHRMPLCLGGTNDRDNLAAICCPCHQAKCYGEHALTNVEDTNPLLSRFNRETYGLFTLSPKPPQLVGNVHEPQPGAKTLQADVVRCRYTQFVENVHEIPVYCALDEVRPREGHVLGDYNFLHRTRDLRSPRKLLPYWGPGWYWRAETEWMLDVGIITWDEVKLTFTASAHVAPSFLADRLKRLETIWTASQEKSALDAPVEAKHVLNSMFGIWSILEHYAYKLTVASDPDDILAETVRKTPSPGSEMVGDNYLLHDYVTRTKLHTFASMRPVHQICLSQERLVMAKLWHILDRLQIPRKLLSFRNDGASIQPGKHLEATKRALDVSYGDLTSLRRYDPLRACVRPRLERQSASSTKVFRLKEYKAGEGGKLVPLEPDMPGGGLSLREGHTPELQHLDWSVFTEPQEGPDDFYELIRHRIVELQQQALITGPGGAGKSYILQLIMHELRAAGHNVEKITLTHVACRRLKDAKTAHSFVFRNVLNGSFKGWLLIDEVGMLPASILTVLENLATLDVKFVMFGDWHQLGPPLDHWRAARIAPGTFQHSRLLHLWAGGTEFRLTRCRRSNRTHFNFCLELLPMPLADGIAACRAAFPPGPGPLHRQADLHLVLSHWRRTELNKLCQQEAVERYRREHPDGVVVAIGAPEDERGLNLQQDFELCAGTKLIGANNDTRGVVNGGFMTVTEVREDECDVVDEFGEGFTLTHKQVARSTRLAWAITVLASQSREFACRVCVWDVESRHFSRQSLYVAVTRVKIGEPGCALIVA